MEPVEIFEAASGLSGLVRAVESGETAEIVITRNGRPVARLVPLAPGPRIGVAAARFRLPDDMDADDAEIAAMFGGTAG